jgi:hypothetical protein
VLRGWTVDEIRHAVGTICERQIQYHLKTFERQGHLRSAHRPGRGARKRWTFNVQAALDAVLRAKRERSAADVAAKTRVSRADAGDGLRACFRCGEHVWFTPCPLGESP